MVMRLISFVLFPITLQHSAEMCQLPLLFRPVDWEKYFIKIEEFNIILFLSTAFMSGFFPDLSDLFLPFYSNAGCQSIFHFDLCLWKDQQIYWVFFSYKSVCYTNENQVRLAIRIQFI